MARKGAVSQIRPTLLDRLIDLEPRVTQEPPSYRTQSLREMKESLRRDLEWLLNARRTPQAAPPSAVELSRSVYNFGLPDFTNYSLKSDDEKRRLAQVIESAILNFEPRLTGVTVTVREASTVSRVLRFHIEALLRAEPAPERIFFDAKLELSTSQYRVEGDSVAK
jgi:type VI secretion system protein ImpF